MKKVYIHAITERGIQNNFRVTPVPVSGYADDINMLSDTGRLLQSMLQTLCSPATGSNLDIRTDKCFIFYEPRSGNRWYKGKNDHDPVVYIHGEQVKVLQRHEPFTYLGKPLTDTVVGESETHVDDMLSTYTELLEKVALCSLPLAFKLDALQTVAMSKIEHGFVNTTNNEVQLEFFDKILVKNLRRIFAIETNTTVRSCSIIT